MTKSLTPEIIDLDGIEINVLRNARRKRVSLEVDASGVKVRAPLKMRPKTINDFVQSKRTWIKHHYHNRPTLAPTLNIENGITLKLLDDDFILRVIENKRAPVQINSTHIELPVIQTQRPIEKTIKDKLIKWYKQQALNCLQDKVDFFAGEMGIPLKNNLKIKVRDYKRRWGSCDHNGDLAFNWRIIMAPETVIDYIAVHEIAHMREFNHSKRFWAIVAAQLPEWRQEHQWLSDNGSYLYRF